MDKGTQDSVEIVAGGLNETFVELRFVSQIGQDISDDIEVYVE